MLIVKEFRTAQQRLTNVACAKALESRTSVVCAMETMRAVDVMAFACRMVPLRPRQISVEFVVAMMPVWAAMEFLLWVERQKRLTSAMSVVAMMPVLTVLEPHVALQRTTNVAYVVAMMPASTVRAC